MHIKRMHEMIEKLTECALCEINKGIECVDTKEFGEVIDIIKDLAEGEYHARLAKCLEKGEKNEEEEEKYFLMMLKEEYKDEYKRMRDEYGDGEEADRRFYDNYRYKSSGRFAPKGSGTRYGRRGSRRGYEEPMYHMTPDMMRDHEPEYWRDVDRHEGRMYYSSGTDGNSNAPTAQYGNAANSGPSGDVRGYSDGYSDGYSEGERVGRSSQIRDRREGRSGQMRRSYMETKEINKGNTPEEKQHKMKELEKYMGELSNDISEMINDASQEEKNLLRQKLQVLTQKIA